MRNSFKKTALLITMILAGFPLLTGCVAIVAASAGAGAYAYLKGSLDSHLNASLEDSMPAVRNAMGSMNLTKIKEVSDTRSAKFTYRDALDTRVIIVLEQKQNNLTAISIRVGHVGDENRSLQILNSINDEL